MFYLNGLTDSLAANSTLTQGSAIAAKSAASYNWGANPAIGINSQISSKLAGAIGNVPGGGSQSPNTNTILSKQFEIAVKMNEKFKNFWGNK